MKKYNFTKSELWFSRRALQELACSEGRGFARHIKRTWRFTVGNNESAHWEQDEVYLLRIEGGRNVRRRAEIFDLETSNTIMMNYRKNVPPDYKLIIGRFAELLKQNNDKRIEMIKASLKDSGTFVGYIDDYASSQIEMLEVITGFRSPEKKRIILDYRCGVFKLVKEEDGGTDNCLPRSLFGPASDMLIFKKRYC